MTVRLAFLAFSPVWARGNPLYPFTYLLLFSFSLSYSLHLFSCYSIPSYCTRIVLLRFHARCRKRLNVVFFFDFVLCIFMLVFVVFDLVLSCGVIVVSSVAGASVVI